MSKSSKLERMAKTVLQTTGLKYTPSGETVELNFFPDSKNLGVSVPLVLTPNTGPCAAIKGPTTGNPYAYIVDSKPYSVDGGEFYSVGDHTQTKPGFRLPGSDSNQEQVYRSRTLNERIVDEIGIELEEVASNNWDGGGPGTFLKFPVGTYRLSGSAPHISVDRSALYWCNYTQAFAEAQFDDRKKWLERHKGITGTREFNSSTNVDEAVTRNFISGVFYVTNATDKWVLLHGAELTKTVFGFGIGGYKYPFFGPTPTMFSKLEIWKIG